MDMEMVQFHPTGLLIGTRMITGSVLEEGLRGAGGYLKNGLGERFMHKYDSREERATRDVVSRGSYTEIMEGRGTADEGVLLDASHLGADFIQEKFRGMTLRCKDMGYDLTREPVPVSPTAHFMMGGVPIDPECRTALEGLFAAGEDASGVHGANRLGGNGVAESTVYGGLAGDVMATVTAEMELRPFSQAQVEALIEKSVRPVMRETGGSVYELRDRMKETMWRKAGVVRERAQLESARADLAELREQLGQVSAGGGREYNLAWADTLNMENYLDVSEAIVNGALAREESRGSHYRTDFPDQDDANFRCNLMLTKSEPRPVKREVVFSRMSPDLA
jgi:succinate dehydrogenase / fumarate reductase flavoprotein subunit/fumarate reductase flavoprotein subunit